MNEFSDTKQRVNKNRTKHFPCCNFYFIGTEDFFVVLFDRQIKFISHKGMGR